MPSYEASHEFDKRGHRHHQPMPAIRPPPPAGRHGEPPHQPGANPPFNNRHPQDRRHGGRPERRGPPVGPVGHGPHGGPPPYLNVNFPPHHHPPNGPLYTNHPGPTGYYSGPEPLPGPPLPPGMPLAQMYGPGGIPPSELPTGMVIPYGPPAPYPVARPPYPSHGHQPYGQPSQGYGQPSLAGAYPPSQPHGHPQPHGRFNHNHHSGGRGRWEYGQRNRYDSAPISLPKPPPGLPSKPVASKGVEMGDGESGYRGHSAGAGGDRPEESAENQNQELNYG